MSMNTLNVFAQSFTDVKDGFWAKDYINKLVELKVVNGYPDATFKPNNNVSKLATLTMIYKSVKAADKLGDFDEAKATNKYFYTLQQYNIPEWAKAGVTFGLDKELIELTDLTGMFNSDNSQKNATRTEVAVYVGKLLETLLGEDVQGMVALTFKDSMFISSESAPYVDLLARKKILAGDENGNFNPNEPIMRSASAKIISMTYDLLKNQQAITNDSKVISGDLLHILDDKTILVQDDDKNKLLYKVDDKVDIIINDKISTRNALTEGQKLKVTVNDDGTVKSIVINQSMVTTEGKFQNVISMQDYYLVVIKDSNEDNKTFKTSSITKVYLNDVATSLQSIQYGDKVKLELDGDIITKIKAESKTRTYQGILEKSVYLAEAPMITFRTNTQNVYTYEIDEDVYIKRNNKKTQLDSLKKGDIVDITIKYDKVERIIATTLKKETNGVIAKIVLGNTNEITIKDDENKEYTYEITNDVDIEVDDKSADINDLKVGYKVELEIESDQVTEINAEKIETSSKLDGVIINVYSDFEAIKLKVKTNDGETKEMTVLVDNADITSSSGSSKRFSDLDEGDEVFVYGKKGKDIFDFAAETVIIVKNNN